MFTCISIRVKLDAWTSRLFHRTTRDYRYRRNTWDRYKFWKTIWQCHKNYKDFPAKLISVHRDKLKRNSLSITETFKKTPGLWMIKKQISVKRYFRQKTTPKDNPNSFCMYVFKKRPTLVQLLLDVVESSGYICNMISKTINRIVQTSIIVKTSTKTFTVNIIWQLVKS